MDSKLPRRYFVSASVLSGLGIFLNSDVKGASLDEKTSESLAVPMPADSLIDFLTFLSDIEGGILGPYYNIISRLAHEVASKTKELTERSNELKLLVPQLKTTGDISRLLNAAEIANLTATSMIYFHLTEDTSLIDSHSNLVKRTTADLKSVAINWESQQETITLSPEAVKVLRRIVQLIDELDLPSKDLKKASDLLTQTSNDLRNGTKNKDGTKNIIGTKEIKSLIVDSVKLLLSADIIESPPSQEVLNNILERLRIQKKPTTMIELRKKALLDITTARNLIRALDSFTIPSDLQQYKADIKEKDVISRESLQHMLSSAINRISLSIEHPQQTNSKSGEVNFIKVSSRVADEGRWDPKLWNQIVAVMGELIPQANKDRVDMVYGIKLGFKWGVRILVSKTEQFNTFDELLPNLPDISEIDLKSDKNTRKEAARRLTNL